eukprot:CAMPEP_0184718380 /NCGR_PEP_ID=MMETSP0314-20130426/7597_1 /TAXON_ID=38298 /ORGANISM="Rhodella maculata, Strain CCMP 736" /LENGTH=73 /DNA_ID=CAMNT_0027182115 /DNA_START=245 /DNA_END=466 /DNA_ORIENTATION=-
MDSSAAIAVPNSSALQKRSPQYAESGSLEVLRQRQRTHERSPLTCNYDKERWMSEMNLLVASAFQQQEPTLDV